jgi:hypothetical protein
MATKMTSISSMNKSMLVDETTERQHTQSFTMSNHLVGTTFNKSKIDFRNPYLKQISTFGSSKFGKINKKVFMREFKGEFIGKSSPSPNLYQVSSSDFDVPKFSSK